jgi:hypothetical protein
VEANVSNRIKEAAEERDRLRAAVALREQNERDLAMLRQLREHPAAGDVADWLERAIVPWYDRPSFITHHELATRLVALLRGGA